MLFRALLIALTAIWFWPSLALNESTLRWAADRLRHEGWDVRWEKLEIDARSISFWTRRVAVRARDVCVVRERAQLRVCAKWLGVSGAVGLRGFRFALNQLDPITLEGGSFSIGKVRGTADLIEGTLQATVKVTPLEIRARGRLHPDAELRRLEADLETTVSGVSRLPVPRVKSLPWLRPPDEARLRLRAVVESEGKILDPGGPVRGWADARLEPLRIPGLSFEAGAGARVRMEGVLTDALRTWRKLEGDGEVAVDLREFEQLVARLDPTAWAVPAPFNALEGVVRLEARAQLRGPELKTPVRFRTRLLSAGQALKIDADVALRFFEGTTLSADVTLTDVQLALPKLDLAAPPRLLPDRRIRRFQEAGELPTMGEGPFRYRIQIRTPPTRPIRLLSNLAGKPVPVQLDLSLRDDQPFNGAARILDFPLQLFRRDARVEHFDVNVRTGEVDGRLRVDYTDYRVTILVGGTLSELEVRLQSDPPVAESQLLAVLLFGREIEELDPDETESIGSTRAAIADGALSLASAYALAATPIESVGYDPENGTFSAKVKLGEGTSLNVGAGADEYEHIGIRRRLSRFWTLTTDLEHPTGPDQRSVSAFLEWSHRY